MCLPPHDSVPRHRAGTHSGSSAYCPLFPRGCSLRYGAHVHRREGKGAAGHTLFVHSFRFSHFTSRHGVPDLRLASGRGGLVRWVVWVRLVRRESVRCMDARYYHTTKNIRASTCVYACRWRNLSRCPDTSATTVWNAQSEEQERANAEAGRNLLELLQPKSKLLPLMRNGAHHGGHQSGSSLSHDGVPPGVLAQSPAQHGVADW